MMPPDLPPQRNVCPVQEERAAEATLEQASAARLAGDYPTARCMIDQILSAQPQNADALVQLGLVDAAEGDASQARAAFQLAVHGVDGRNEPLSRRS